MKVIYEVILLGYEGYIRWDSFMYQGRLKGWIPKVSRSYKRVDPKMYQGRIGWIPKVSRSYKRVDP